jgi:hypothetical protein
MGWIKRNLFFVIGGIIALGLLGATVFYVCQGLSDNSAATAKLGEIYDDLKNLAQQKPVPSDENAQTAREQAAQVRAWVKSVGGYFRPIPSIPAGVVTGEAFAGELHRTIDQLQREAEDAGVALPPQYDFSFAAQRPLVKFAPGSLDPLAAQLGEVKTIAEIIFSARVNNLDGIQRTRVSDDDTGGLAADYIDDISVTNSMAVITPYVITFRSFTPELARVLAAFATATNAFVVTAVNVVPAGSAATTPDMANGASPPPGMPPMQGMDPGLPNRFAGRFPGGYPGGRPPMEEMGGKGGLQTVLKEQLLRITLEVKLVKLLPKS